MRINILILITSLYFCLSLLFNYSLYPLLITNEYSNQYFLIFVYFLSELFSFLFLIYTKKHEKKIITTFGSALRVDESINFSNLSETYNNLTTSINISDTAVSSMQPFIGMKWPSFIFPAILDFLYKFFLFNGLKIIGNDIILRAIIELMIVFFFSKIMLQSKYNRFNIIGVIIIFLGLIVICFYCQISKNIKLYFQYNNNSAIGMLLCLIGEIFGAIQIFLQIKYIRIGERHSCREISWEGVFGLIISFIFFIISISFPSYETNYKESQVLEKKFWYCLKDSTYSSISNLFNIIKDNIVWYIVYFLVCCFYNLIGIIISKYIGELYRTAINVGRLSILIFLILFIHNDDNIGALNCVFCIIFFICVLVGILLSIILRKQKDNFGERCSFPEIDLKDDIDIMNNKDENNHLNK